MIYIRVVNELPVEWTSNFSPEQHKGSQWQSRRDWQDYATVERFAQYLTAATGKTYLPADYTENVSPRYDIIEAPKVGDLVSYGFNGDYYPCGAITKITKGWRVTTSGGKKFNRFKQTGNWLAIGGTWSMVSGHINERNPHV
ncbi:MAG: hypothetical protein DDT31_00649 [Syntrophomonadaceae bacterium]|nr:hypothetical protein [Bacillota bacterium]